MVKCFELPNSSFCLLDYAGFLSKIESKIIDDLHKFDLLDDLSLQKYDVKKIFYHHIIYNLCDLIINNKLRSKPVVYYHSEDIELELFKFSSKYKVLAFINTVTNKVKRLLPLKIYESDESFHQFTEACISRGATGERAARINIVNEFINRHNIQKYNFAGVKSFVKRYELTYLSETYFHNIKTKNLMFL